MKKIILYGLIIFIFLPVCYANDSGVLAVGGTWVVMKGEHPSVQMERETIDMNVYAEYYDVIAMFTFKNTGDECSVYMGFPESGYGDMGGYRDSASAFLKFSTSVDGVTVEAKRQLAKDESSDGDYYKAYWIKQVSFKKNETKKIIVKYRSPLGSGISAFFNGEDEFVSYIFSGGNWFGKVAESKLNIYFNVPVDIRQNKDTELKKELDHYTYYRTNWEAEDYLRVNFKIKKEKNTDN